MNPMPFWKKVWCWFTHRNTTTRLLPSGVQYTCNTCKNEWIEGYYD